MISSHLCLGLPSDFFFRFSYQIFLCSSLGSIRAACPVHLIFLGSTILIISGEEYKLSSSSFCNFLQPPVSSSLFGPNIPLSARSQTLSVYEYAFPLIWETKFHTHTKLLAKLYICEDDPTDVDA
jgi:hypothetical protein